MSRGGGAVFVFGEKRGTGRGPPPSREDASHLPRGAGKAHEIAWHMGDLRRGVGMADAVCASVYSLSGDTAMIQRMVSAVVLVAVSGSAMAQVRVESALCRDSVVNEIVTGRVVDDLLVDGSVMYELSDDQVRVYSLSDPIEPTLVRTYELGFFASRLWVNNERLYVAGRTTIGVFDAQDAANLVELNTLEFEHTDAASYRFVGDRVFLAGDFLGLLSFDFTDVMNPVRSEVEARFPGSGPVVLELVGSSLVYGEPDRAKLYNISQVSTIDLIGDFGLFLTSQRTAAGGSYLFKSGTDEKTLETGLLVYDVADPLSPVLIASEPVMLGDIDLIADSGLLVVRGNGTAEVFDVSDLTDPVRLGSMTTELRFDASAAAEGYLYLTPRGALRVVDLTLIGDTRAGVVATPSGSRQIELDGDLVYVLDTFGGAMAGVRVVDIAEPTNPVLRGSVDVPGYTADFTIDWPWVYTANRFNGMSVVDVSDPDAPVALSTINLNGDYLGIAMDVAVSGDVAYVANSRRLVLLDVTDRGSPEVLEEIELDAQAVFVHSNRLLVAAPQLMLFDISDPVSPEFISELEGVTFPTDTWYAPSQIVVVGDRYFVSGEGRVREIRVGDGGELELVGEHGALQGFSTGFDIEGDLLLMSDSGGGHVYRFGDDGTSAYLESFTSDRGWDLELRGGYVYSTSGGEGVVVYDLSTRCETCSADLNGDGVLNYFDAAALMAAYLEGDVIADLNGDGSIDFLDVSAFLESYGDGCG